MMSMSDDISWDEVAEESFSLIEDLSKEAHTKLLLEADSLIAAEAQLISRLLAKRKSYSTEALEYKHLSQLLEKARARIVILTETKETMRSRRRNKV